MTLYEFFLAPFNDYLFMRRALVACLSLSLSCGGLGIWLVLRRMSLMGDALSHAILPGAALGYLFAGLSLPAMGLGGMLSALLVALLAGLASRRTILYEEASMAGFYLLSMALGVILVSTRGGNVDLMHVLFGTLLGVTREGMALVSFISILSISILALIHRPLTIESFDPFFLRSLQGKGSLYHMIFVTLVVLNLVASFQVLGTLLSLGMMILPAVTARLWGRTFPHLFFITISIGVLSAYGGLLFSYHADLPSGPSLILFAGFFYCLSLLIKIFFQKKYSLKAISLLLASMSSLYAQPKPLQVVATFSILGDWAHQIGQDKVQVHVIVGPNGDAHVYEPTPADARLLVNADVIFLNGLDFEGWMERLIQASGTKALVVPLANTLPHIKTMPFKGQKKRDPHVWHNVKHAQHMVKKMGETLIMLRPAHASYFQEKSHQYLAQLQDLDQWIEKIFQKIPRSQRRVITLHDGFSYFGERYEIDFLAPMGVSTETAPSAQTVKNLIDQIKGGEIYGIFLENICHEHLLTEISKETGLPIGGTLYSDALSPLDEPASTYIELVRHNVKTLIQSLEKTKKASRTRD